MRNRADATASRRPAQAQLPVQGQVAPNGKHVATGHIIPFGLTVCHNWMQRGGAIPEPVPILMRYTCRRWSVAFLGRLHTSVRESRRCQANHPSLVPYWPGVLRLYCHLLLWCLSLLTVFSLTPHHCPRSCRRGAPEGSTTFTPSKNSVMFIPEMLGWLVLYLRAMHVHDKAAGKHF